MNKTEFIDYIISNGYAYTESTDEIEISRTGQEDKLDSAITYDKKGKTFTLWLQNENGSGRSTTLNEFEMRLISELGGAEWK